MSAAEFRHFWVQRSDDGQLKHSIRTSKLDVLPVGDVLIRVAWSSLNYKDALATQAHPGVVRDLPHIPGIDAAGTVVSSGDERYAAGDEVLVTGYDFGSTHWGGWSEYARVPADWIVPLPNAMSLRNAMILGTAGFTAAQCVRALQVNGVEPGDGPIAVTGATGGVGSFAVRLLSHAGFDVHAITGKHDVDESLRRLGASEVHDRVKLEDHPKRPMLSATWAGGIDTVGGSMLTALLKSTQVGGCVSACGLVAGDDLPLTVYPFILRGVTLAGVTSASCSRSIREWVWDQLATHWKIQLPDELVHEKKLDSLANAITDISNGQVFGRVIVDLR